MVSIPHAQGKVEEAKSLAVRAIQIQETISGPTRTILADSLNTLAELLQTEVIELFLRGFASVYDTYVASA